MNEYADYVDMYNMLQFLTRFVTILDPCISIGEPNCTYRPFDLGEQYGVWIHNPDGSPFIGNYFLTRTKTSIRYAKENDREKRERKKGRRRDIEREGDIREIERKRQRETERERGERDRERVKGRLKSL